MLLLPSAVLGLSLSHVLGHVIEGRNAQPTTVPAPIPFAPDNQWDGIDGNWSTYTLGIGTPQQYIRTLLSWSSYQTWAVIPPGCEAAEDYGACAQIRGGIFNYSASSTWQQKGIYDLWIEKDLGYDGNADYGFDTVHLGGSGSNGPTIKDTIVGGFAVEAFYLGVFGINPKPTNFTTYSDQSTSYMSFLKEQSYIPSISFGYTAGAPYRQDFGGLTLGGFDTSKFTPNDVEFTFAVDNDRNIVVGIQSITTPSKVVNSPTATELLPTAIYASMDATVPQIWLPPEACQAFEEEFGLTYDNTTELYLVNDTLHQDLLDRNASITFFLGIALENSLQVQIELPYAAFDLVAQSPYQNIENSSYYFPLRQAVNASQYTIGRAFFQEAYITVDYESAKFNVSQRNWDTALQPHLVVIPPFNATEASTGSTKTSSGSSGLSPGAIAGIVVGAVAVVILVALLLVWHFRRRSRGIKDGEHEKLGSDDGSATLNAAMRDSGNSGNSRGREVTVFPKAELEGSSPTPPLRQDPDVRALLSANGGASTSSGTPRTPNANLSPGAFRGSGFFHRTLADGSESPSTPSHEEGTHSSSQTGTGSGLGTMMSLVSPMSDASEADSKERVIHEMAGDMPAVREKDGRQLSEKEALAHRERVYNGVDTPPRSATEDDDAVPGASREPPRRVSPEDVEIHGALVGDEDENAIGVARSSPRDFMQHRAFSFEDDRPPRADDSSGSLYSSG